MYVIVANYVNWHRDNLWLDGEKLGKRREFENTNSCYPVIQRVKTVY